MLVLISKVIKMQNTILKSIEMKLNKVNYHVTHADVFIERSETYFRCLILCENGKFAHFYQSCILSKPSRNSYLSSDKYQF